MRSTILWFARVLILLGPTALAFASGGYFTDARLIAGLVVWSLVLLAMCASTSSLPRTTIARLALGSFALLTVWVAFSMLWAPLGGPALHDTQRMLLYLGALIAASALLRPQTALRAVEPCLAFGTLAVIGYGLAGRFLPSLVHTTASASAGGRLEQPLTYWNAQGALAAIGIVLCVHLCFDKTRSKFMRITSGIAVLPLSLGLYLTYSRGALAALAVGLIVLVLLTRSGPQLQRFRLAIFIGLAILTIGSVITIAVTENRPKTTSPEFGANAKRLRSVDSNRYAYWRVAMNEFTKHPIQGVGTGGFRVSWLAQRPFPEPVKDAHSLYIETLTELGLVGFALLLTFLFALLACARRAWLANPSLVSGWCAALTVFVTHCALDWDFEMPALSLIALVLSSALIAVTENQIKRTKSDERDGAEFLATSR
jgi:O-antigen ligase